VEVKLTKNQVLLTNEVAQQNHIQYGTKLELKDVNIAIPHMVEVGKIPLSFGDISYNYLKSERDVPLVVFCGGNGFRLNYGGALLGTSLSQMGDVLMFDYPGMGESGGDGRRIQFNETLTAVNNKALTIAATRKNKQIIYYGHSFGGGVCSLLANKNPDASALILAATFADYHDVAESIKPLLSKFARLKIDEDTPEFKIPSLLTEYENPIIVIASKTDDTIKFPVSEKLYYKLLKQGNNVQFISLENAAHSIVPADKELQTKLISALNKASLE
jgi:pimeloyl-ACP methyl ester carboxylesterase